MKFFTMKKTRRLRKRHGEKPREEFITPLAKDVVLTEYKKKNASQKVFIGKEGKSGKIKF